MSQYEPPFEIHVHGDVPLRPEVSFDELQEALKPLWKYAGARSLAAAAASHYDDEPGIEFDAKEHVLHLCWTVLGRCGFPPGARRDVHGSERSGGDAARRSR